MALTTDEQELLDFALSALPPWFSDTESRDMHMEAAYAKMAGAARAQAEYWFSQALITTATGPGAGTPDWLQLHAIDRGTRRQASETDEALRSRLRTYPDAVTPPALLAVAQAIVDAAGVVGDVAMVELRRDRIYLGKNAPMSGVGGTFTEGDFAEFQPSGPWSRPPFAGLQPDISWSITLTGALDGGNDGTYPIVGLLGDKVQYVQPGLPTGPDPVVTWRIDRYDRDGNLLTGGTGRADAYASRGHRVGSTIPQIIIILPYGTDAALAAAVAEAIRQRKAAGIWVQIEYRQNP